MSKKKTGIVLDDDLFAEYHRFRGNLSDNIPYNEDTVSKIMSFFKAPITTNLCQYKRCKVPLPRNLEIQLKQKGLDKQTLEELAQEKSLYKIIISGSQNDYPYVDIIHNPWIENNFGVSLFRNEPRDKAVHHLASLCKKASKISIYDKYIENEDNNLNLELLGKIFPDKKLSICFYSKIKDDFADRIKAAHANWSITKDPNPKNFHDRYIIIDDELEIILTGGVSKLATSIYDFTYIIRETNKSRFN